MTRRRVFVCAAIALMLSSREAGADILKLKTPSTVTTEGGSTLSLPPGYFLDEQTWQERDLEMRRLQDQEHRLKAENDSLRKSADFPPWGTVAMGVVGVALGVVAMVLK